MSIGGRKKDDHKKDDNMKKIYTICTISADFWDKTAWWVTAGERKGEAAEAVSPVSCLEKNQ